MFWALISPFRHTAEPPQLGPNNPIRIFLQNHGAAVARRPVLTIVLSVITSVILSYPFFIYYEATSPGLPSVPHHVWTSARPFSTIRGPHDIEIKQAWIQGSRMGALEPHVVKEALKIQEALLGSSVFCTPPSEADCFQLDSSSTSALRCQEYAENQIQHNLFIHSPLLYWNCSLRAIEEDQDIIHTVNVNSERISPSNLTLHWGSVFAGKRLSQHKLVAADALVISVFYRPNSDIGKIWDKRSLQLAADAKLNGQYDVYPKDGKVAGHEYYEFFFQQMSKTDKLVLSACYVVAAIFLIAQLCRVRAVKSRFGLICAIIIQLGASIMTSFTVLAFLKIPVSHIPREVFPFIVIIIGIENMLRLIHAVLDTPQEFSTTVRISMALGEVGFLATVAVATDLAILLIVGLFSVPAVREFCIFAGIALMMDFLLHLTFFLAVLSVDVRRFELQDFLEKLDLSRGPRWENRSRSPSKTGRMIFEKAVPLTSRIAGTAIMICVLLALNWHFFDNQTPWRTFLSLINEFATTRQRSAIRRVVPIDMPENVARTPTSWLKLQDQLTGKELIKLIKPGDHRVMAKVYNPVFVVMKGSDRIKTTWDFNILGTFIDLDAVRGHTIPFIVTVVVAAALVTLLMNQMLSRELSEEPENLPEGPLLTTQTLYEGHSLDVVAVCACQRGIVVSVGLDHRIVVWNLRSKWGVTKDIITPACSEQTLWPVMAIALDNMGQWLAIAPRSGMVSLWQVNEGTFYRSIPLELRGVQPSAFFFAPRHDDHAGGGPRLLVLRQNGWLTEISVMTGQLTHHRICDGVVVSSSHGVSMHGPTLRIVTACQQGRIFVTAKYHGDWYTDQLHLVQFTPPRTLNAGESCIVLPLPHLGMVVSSRACNVDLVDLLSGNIVRSFQVGEFKPGSLRAFHAKKQTCLYCGCPSVRSFSIAYSERESGMFMMHTFVPDTGKSKDICLRVERDRREKKCLGFEAVVQTMHWLDNVDGWESTSLNMVAGIRRLDSSQSEQSSDEWNYGTSNILRQRRKKIRKVSSGDDDEEWESFTMTADGVVTHYPLNDRNSLDDDKGLLVSHAGPVTRVGQRSIAVAFGNTVKILILGNERYDDDDDEHDIAAARSGRRNHRR